MRSADDTAWVQPFVMHSSRNCTKWLILLTLCHRVYLERFVMLHKYVPLPPFPRYFTGSAQKNGLYLYHAQVRLKITLIF